MIPPCRMLVGVTDFRSVRSNKFMFAHGNRAFRVFFQQFYPGFDALWQEAIVVIEKQDILAPAVQKTGIAGS